MSFERLAYRLRLQKIIGDDAASCALRPMLLDPYAQNPVHDRHEEYAAVWETRQARRIGDVLPTRLSVAVEISLCESTHELGYDFNGYTITGWLLKSCG